MWNRIRTPWPGLAAVLVMLFGASFAPAQIARDRIYSNPQPPSDEILRRLNLTLAWKGYVPVESKRDGILRVEIEGRDLFVLTRSGQVMRMDAETGKVVWRTRISTPYTMLPFFAANGRSVYVISNADLIAIDRARGTKKWEYRLRAGISAAPVVDEQQIYVPTSTGHLYAFALPFVGVGGETRQAESSGQGFGASAIYGQIDKNTEARPTPLLAEQTNMNLTFRPLQTADLIFLISREGRVIGLNKARAEDTRLQEPYNFPLGSEVRVAPGQFFDTAYVGADDAAVYAINMNNGRLRWRYTAGSPITRRPIALDTDVFATSEREGMTRIDRATGAAGWRIPCGRNLTDANRDADEFLAANDRFVYASDHSGRLLVLDRKRGVRLSQFDTTAFRVKVVNELTDRLYLAAHDGLIICLHDRDQTSPIRHRGKYEDAMTGVGKLLDQPITTKESKPMPLREALNELRTKYKLKFVLALNAFKQADNPNVQDRTVTPPVSDNRPLKDHLQRILTQVNATYELVDETVLIVPGKAKK